MDPKRKLDVIDFLRTCEIVISKREKNMEFIRLHALTINEVEDVIRSLTKYDCIQGPMDDENPRYIGSVYVFNKQVFDIGTCYIKIRVIEANKPVVIISFHENEC